MSFARTNRLNRPSVDLPSVVRCLKSHRYCTPSADTLATTTTFSRSPSGVCSADTSRSPVTSGTSGAGARTAASTPNAESRRRRVNMTASEARPTGHLDLGIARGRREQVIAQRLPPDLEHLHRRPALVGRLEHEEPVAELLPDRLRFVVRERPTRADPDEAEGRRDARLLVVLVLALGIENAVVLARV